MLQTQGYKMYLCWTFFWNYLPWKFFFYIKCPEFVTFYKDLQGR
jgi:hypothetical protein